MKILIIKTSSLGDVIHTLPAVTDLMQYRADISCDWVVEAAYSELPNWHPAVQKVIPVAVRDWRKKPFKTIYNRLWQQYVATVSMQHYDYIIDAQGLLKSAILARQAGKEIWGFDAKSAREPLATWYYTHKISVNKSQHAITRVRHLFANIFNYNLPTTAPDYAIQHQFPAHKQNYLIFFHGTTWPSKHWNDDYWLELANLATNHGYTVGITWGNLQEQQRAQYLANKINKIKLIPKTNLTQLAQELAQAKAVVGVDTGLAHLAAALNIPSITLYGATQPGLTGTMGQQQIHLLSPQSCAPCMQRICKYKDYPCYQDLNAAKIWQQLTKLLAILP